MTHEVDHWVGGQHQAQCVREGIISLKVGKYVDMMLHLLGLYVHNSILFRFLLGAKSGAP